MITQIVSGGQTGADRAALDVAIRYGLAHGGWCPKGRKAEDGVIDQGYMLQETPDVSYKSRTRANVCDSDGTVIFSLASELIGGSLQTLEYARELKKPHIHIARERRDSPAELLLSFVSQYKIRILNVAGPRESKEPGIYDFVFAVLQEAFWPKKQVKE